MAVQAATSHRPFRPVETVKAHPALATACALVAIVAAAFVWGLTFANKVTEPWVWPDEVTYVKNALLIWDLHRLVLPSELGFNSWAQLQPLIMAPLWGLMSTQTAYHATHVVNSLMLASTAIPVYLLARRLAIPRALAVATAALCIVTPWITIAGVMMTEVATFPVFAWALLAVHVAVSEPSRRHDIVALLALGVAFLGRPHMMGLGLAFVLSVLVQEVRFSRSDVRGALSRHAVLVAGAVLAAGVLVVSGVHSNRLVGVYSVATNAGLFPKDTVSEALECLAYVVVAIAIIPLALTLAFALEQFVRPESRERHAFALLAITSSIFLMYFTGVFSAQFTSGTQDRYLCFLVVPFFLGTACWLTNARPRIWALALGAPAAGWVVLRSALGLRGPSLVSPSGGWHQVLFGKVAEFDAHVGTHWLTAQRAMAIATVVGSLGLLALRRLRPTWRIVPWLAIAALGVYCVAETRYTMHGILRFEYQRVGGQWASLDWVDDRVPHGTKVPVMLSDMGSPPDASAIWDHYRFWNKTTREALVLPNTDTMDQQYRVDITLDDKKGVIPALADKRFVVHATPDKRYQLQGAKQLHFQDSLELLRLPGSGRIDWLLHANNDPGLVPAHQPATLRVFPPAGGGAQRFTLAITPNYEAAGDHYDYVLSGAGVDKRGRVKVGTTATVNFDVRPPAGGFSELRLRAIGRVDKRYPLGGLLIQDLHSQPAPRHAPG